VVPGVEHARVAESDLRAYADRVRTFFERWLLDEQSAVSESAVSSQQSAVGSRQSAGASVADR
jgi:hypothetical protein